jgi:hypothetical protein
MKYRITAEINHRTEIANRCCLGSKGMLKSIYVKRESRGKQGKARESSVTPY